MSHRQISTSWWQPANFLGHTQLLFEIYWECGSFPSRYLDKIWMLFLLLVALEMKSPSNFASPGDWQAIKAMIHGPKLPAASSLFEGKDANMSASKSLYSCPQKSHALHSNRHWLMAFLSFPDQTSYFLSYNRASICLDPTSTWTKSVMAMPLSPELYLLLILVFQESNHSSFGMITSPTH